MELVDIVAETEIVEVVGFSSVNSGKGVPAGGTTGQVLAKASDNDYDDHWANPSASGVQSVTAGDGTVTIGGTGTNPTVAAHTGTTVGTVAAGNDSRLSDSRAPTGAAGGDLTGTYPNPTYTTVPVAKGGTGSTTAASARTALGLAIGTDVEAHDTDLTTIAALTPTNDDVIQRKAGAWTNRTPAQLKTDLAIVEADVSGLTTDLAAKAADAAVVHNTGNETVAGTKTFSTPIAIGSGGTGQATQQAAIDALAGTQANRTFLRSDGTHTTLSAIQAADVPTLNQNTTGTAGNVTGTVAIANGGTGQTTQQAALDAVAGAVTSGQVLRGNGTHVLLAALQAADVPNIAESQVTNLVTDLAAKASALAPTAVKTGNYTAAAGDEVPCDTTSGGFTVTLPTAPADKAQVGIKHVIQGGTNVVTIACGGSDVFNKASGPTTGTLAYVNQATVLQYKSSGAIWYAVAGDTPTTMIQEVAPGRPRVRIASTTRLGTPGSVLATALVPVNGSSTTNAITTGQQFMALSAFYGQTIGTLYIMVTATSLTGSQTVEIACYEDLSDGGPGKRLWMQAITVGTSTGTLNATGLSLALPNGSAWVSILNPSGNAGTVTVRAANVVAGGRVHLMGSGSFTPVYLLSSQSASSTDLSATTFQSISEWQTSFAVIGAKL